MELVVVLLVELFESLDGLFTANEAKAVRLN